MPTYVYECTTCNKTLEVEQRITEEPLKDCPCGAKGSLVRLIQPTAVMFRGSGFHINDYARPSTSEEKGDVGPSCGCGPEGCTPKPPEPQA